RGRKLMRDGFVMPMYVPVMVLALGFYALFAKIGMIGNLFAIALAHSILGVPLVIINVSAALYGVNWELERAARSLGAGPIRTFTKVTFPVIKGGVLAGALFAFLVSFDELVIALFLSGPDSTTLPVQMWSSIRFQNDPTTAAASALLLGSS